MRILVYSHFGGNALTGACRSLLSVLRAARQAGHDILVVSPHEGEFSRMLGKEGIRVCVVPHPRWDVLPYWSRPPWQKIFLKLRARWRAAWNMLRCFRRHVWVSKSFRPDVVYTNTTVVPMGALTAMYLGCPHVFHAREFISLDFGRSLAVGWRMFGAVVARSAAVIANSQAVKRLLLRRAPKAPVTVIYNGVPSPDKGCDVASTAAAPIVRFLLLGTYGVGKGQELAVRAAALLKETGCRFEVLMAGDGERRPVRELCRQMDVEGFVFPGPYVVSVEELFRRADVYMMCSAHEAFGRVTVEALLHGLPVIGVKGDYTATGEIVNHGENGLLCEGTPAAICKAMKTLADNPRLRRRLGAAGIVSARERFSEKRYVQAVLDVLANIGYRERVQ